MAPGPSVSETAWLELIRAESDQEVARRLGITDRQVRRIKSGKVSEVRLREHARADPKHRKEALPPAPDKGAGGTSFFSWSGGLVRRCLTNAPQ